MNSKSANSKKVFGKYISSLVVVLVLSVFVMPRTSHAFLSWDWLLHHLDANTYCNPTNKMFEDIAHDQPQQSIIRFGYNYDTVRFLKVFYNVFGVSPDNAIRCLTSFPGTNIGLIGAACEAATGVSGRPDCGNFVLGYNYDSNNPDKFALGHGNGSILSFFYALDSGVESLGNPLDLNYFAYKSFEKTPFIGRALAQGSTDYGAPFVSEIYFAWVMVRNLAFGVFALLMLVVGIMMINRTRLNPQAVVTIQYALPKIVISVILIALSYPIGAIMLTFVWYARSALFSVVYTTGKAALLAQFSSPDNALTLSKYFGTHVSFNMGLFVVQMLLSVILILGVGILAIVLVIILGLLIIVQWILCLVKMVIYYLKMLFEVVLAPVSFVYAAIPGNDDALIGWFKKMLAYTLSIFALSTLPILVLFIALSVSMGLEGDRAISGLGLGSFFTLASSTIAMVAGALITYVGFSMTLKLPAQIEEVLTGKKKGR